MSEGETSKNIFGMESTVSQSASGIMRILILMRMDEMLRDYQAYLNATEGSGEKARLGRKSTHSIQSLLLLLKPRMEKKNKYKEAYELKEKQEEAIIKIMNYLEEDLRLTRVDTFEDFDRTNAELENTKKGL